MPKRILLVYTNYSSFVRQDYEILAEHNQVDKYLFKLSKKAPNFAWQFIRQLFYLIVLGWKYDVFFIWFADYHSLLPVLFSRLTNKKSIIVIGGYDVNCLPEYKYGALNTPLRAFFTRSSLKFSSLCLPVAESLRLKLLKIVPNATAITLATYQDEIKFQLKSEKREKLVLTVATISKFQTFKIKGLDRFKELAESMPEYQFMIIGVQEGSEIFFDPIPENLIILPPVKHNELNDYFNKSSVYLQLSRSEGLPNALCEAMLCGCIPAGMNVGDIPEAIGPYGLVLEAWNPESFSSFIRNETEFEKIRPLVRNRIISKYNISIREEKLKKIINFNEYGK